MKKNPYDLINQSKTPLDNYKKEELTPLEIERMRSYMKNKTNTKKSTPKFRNLGIAAAASAVLMVGAVGGISAAAIENPTAYKIASFLGIEKNLDSYETLLNQEVTKDGVTLALKGAIIDNDELVVSVITTSDQDLTQIYSAPGGQVFINGEEINAGAMMEANLLDAHTIHSLIRFPLTKTFEGDLNIKLKLAVPLQNMQRSPHWVFEFQTSGDNLAAETSKTPIHKIFTLENGAKITLDTYNQNKLSTKIAYSVEGDLGSHFIDIIVKDEDNNQGKFGMYGIHRDTGYFTTDIQTQSILENAQILTLSLFDNDVQVGESIQISK